MAVLPTKTTRFRASGGDPALGRVQDSAGNAIDRILAWLSSYFQAAGPNLIALTTFTFNQLVTFLGGIAVTGDVSAASFTGGTVSGTTGTFSGGIQQGSRHAPYKAFIAATALNGGGTNKPFQLVMPTTAVASAPTQTLYTPPFAGSIAGISLRVYTGTAAAGILTVTTLNVTPNLSIAVTAAQANAGFTVAIPAGTNTYVAGAGIQFRATSNAAWSQGAAAGVEFQAWVYE